MNKKLKNLQKALTALNIENEYLSFSDDSSEWISITDITGDKRTTICIHRDGEIGIYQTQTIWDDDNEIKVL